MTYSIEKEEAQQRLKEVTKKTTKKKRKSLLLVLSLIIIIIGIYIKNMYIYELSHFRCFLVQIVFHGLHKTLMLKYKIYDMINVKWNIYNNSINLRGFEDTMSIISYFSSNINKYPNDKFLEIYTRGRNAYGCLITIPYPTKLTSNLNLTTNAINKIKKNENISKLDVNDKYIYKPKNTNYIWILGNNHIENYTNSSTIIYIHGGGFIFGGPSHVGVASHLSDFTNKRVLYLFYTKTKSAQLNITIPDQVNEVLTAYFFLLFDMNVNKNDIIIIGDSAGGGLALLALQRLNNIGLSTTLNPRGVVLLSPWTDLTLDSPSWKANDNYDVILDLNMVKKSLPIILDQNLTKTTCSYYSSLYYPFSSFSTLPSLMIVTSKNETLYDDSNNLYRKFKQHGFNDLIYVEEYHRPHVWMLFINLFPEAQQTFQKIVNVIDYWFKNPINQRHNISHI